jgi:hypothetical protein
MCFETILIKSHIRFEVYFRENFLQTLQNCVNQLIPLSTEAL